MLLLGYLTYEAQETEATLHLCLSVICGLSIAESIDHLKKIYRKKTLGQFLHLVREKIGLEESFDAYMRDYIDQRNFITHNLSRTSMFSLEWQDSGNTIRLISARKATKKERKFYAGEAS
jgi:uncharacterized DUF497 family protein